MPETADAWIATREADATQDGLERGAAYWEAGWAWIADCWPPMGGAKLARP